MAFAVGSAVVLDFFNCGASMSSSSDAFLFVLVVLGAVEFFASFVAFAGIVLGFVAAGLVLDADLVCFLEASLLTSLDFFAFGSSSDSSALRLLPLDWSSVGGVDGLRARFEARVGAGGAPAAVVFFGGMLANCANA